MDSSKAEGSPQSVTDLPGPSLHGDTIAWNYGGCMHACKSDFSGYRSAILTRHLPDGPVHTWRVTRGRCSSLWPSVWGQILVWHQEGVCQGHLGADVVLVNMETRTLRFLTHNHGSSEAVTNGRYVAWRQGKAGTTPYTQVARMTLLTLASGTRQFFKPLFPHQDVDDQFPVMTSRVLAWETEIVSVIGARDLGTGKVYAAYYRTEHQNIVGMGQAWGRRIAWVDCNHFHGNGWCYHDIGTTTVP